MNVLRSWLRHGLTTLALLLKAGGGLALGPSLFAHSAMVNAEGKTESEVRAAFLVIFAKYTQWPDRALPAEGEEFVVGVLGDDLLVTALKALQDGRVMGRKLIVRRFNTPGDVQRCHVLYVPRGQEQHFPGMRDRLAAQSVLTVGETLRFCELGGALCLVEESSRLRFVVNLTALDQAHLRVEPKALRLAKGILPKPAAQP